jgi:DNA-binding transcriptional MerR regulator
MRFAYYDKLSAARQRIYRQSDAIDTLGLPRGLALGSHVAAIQESLRLDRRTDVQAACQSLIDALTHGYHVPKVRVRVLATRPADAGGELHGLYEPVEDGSPPRISVWMRTAQKKQVVAFKTFLRTLIHELCHHLDYELFALAETFHTEGFYKRESSVVTALLAQAPPSGPESGA